MAVLPPTTNHEHRGARVSAWFLGLVAVLTLERGLIHSFLPAVLVRGLFAWEGATQIALGLGMLAVALRYRPPVPLFLALSLRTRRA